MLAFYSYTSSIPIEALAFILYGYVKRTKKPILSITVTHENEEKKNYHRVDLSAPTTCVGPGSNPQPPSRYAQREKVFNDVSLTWSAF